MKLRTMLILMLSLVLPAIAPSAMAAPPTREELKARFEKRFPQIAKLRQQGKAGETWEGLVEAIDPALVSEAEQETLKQENADRHGLYDLIANDVAPGEQKVSAAVVAQRNAKRNFEKAQADDYLKVKDGRWIQKKNEARYGVVNRLKKDGKIGETWRGTIEAVKSEYADDPQVKGVIAEENGNRQKLYERIAKAKGKDGSAENVAEATGREILDHIAAGEYSKSQDGKWTKKPQRQS